MIIYKNRKIACIILLLLLFACNQDNSDSNDSIVSDSIAHNDDSLFRLPVILPPLYDSNLIDNRIVDKYRRLAQGTEGYLRVISKAEQVSLELLTIIRDNAIKGSDICLMIDRTGSMLDDLMDVSLSINEILDALKNVENLRLSVCFYGDSRVDGKDWFVYRNFHTQIDSSRGFINRTRVIDGGDEPESVYEAFFEFLSRDFWRSGSKRMIVLIGDAPPIEKSEGKYSVDDVILAATRDSIYMNFYPVLIAPAKDNNPQLSGYDLYLKKEFINQIYPNPTSGKVTMIMNKEDMYSFEVFNQAGVLQLNGSFKDSVSNIDLTGLKDGLYAVRVVDSEKNYQTEKVIKVEVK